MNDRLLTPEQIMVLCRVKAMFPKDWCKAQDAKTSKWWIEQVEKLPLPIQRHSMGVDHYEMGYEILKHQSGCLLCKWQALKKQIGGE